MQLSKRDHRSTPPERSQIQPARFLMANNRCLPGLRHAPWRVLAIQHWRRLLRFGRYTAAFRSTAHTRRMECRTRYWPKPPSPCDVVSPGVPRRSAASRGSPSVFAMERAGADGAIAPLMPPKFALVLQSVRLYLSCHYSCATIPGRQPLCDPRRNSPNRGCRCRDIMTRRHGDVPLGADDADNTASTMTAFSHLHARFVRSLRALWAG
jgi:hypothetical protein